jgi:hypothetical protein
MWTSKNNVEKLDDRSNGEWGKMWTLSYRMVQFFLFLFVACGLGFKTAL